MGNYNLRKRGAYTEELGKKYGITKVELRLIPYLHYCITNHLRIDLCKMTGEEHKILRQWEDNGFIEAGLETPCIILNKQFWDKMCDVLYDAYAARYED